METQPLSQVDHAARTAAWTVALEHDGLPPFVTERLAGAAAGRGAWVATMTPAELLLSRTHGLRPVATVSGTCWFHYGQSWTEGHAQGWHDALHRIGLEAAAAGANAVVDVRMRTLRHRIGASMDFTLIGTAVTMDGLPPSPHPVIATVPALEFVRLLEADIVPVGLAVGARYEWLGSNWNSWGDAGALRRTQNATGMFAGNQPLTELMDFWNAIRRDAHRDLRQAAARQGNGVLAHTQFGQLIRQERDKQPPMYLGRHIVVGTVVDTKARAPVPHAIEQVVDMRDALSPLHNTAEHRHGVYDGEMDEEGAI
ncbi:heavy metal-binding domain-containing protein [Sphingomonas bacterium]|uniref:heavy metal-binding domain-containing protein n=1 Tax=Sphingomonas bacterium TaxID=1895847 RepID=UPI001576547F|nr:heavy metal-binding domain-containing protein [Sphingomonas bacterium]